MPSSESSRRPSEAHLAANWAWEMVVPLIRRESLSIISSREKKPSSSTVYGSSPSLKCLTILTISLEMGSRILWMVSKEGRRSSEGFGWLELEALGVR